MLENAIAAERPDVLVTSALALGPLVAGETFGLPVVVVGMLTELLPPGARRDEFQVALDACRAAVGLPSCDVERMRGDVYLARTVPELGPTKHPIGACSWEPPAPARVQAWLDDARDRNQRVVYVQQARGFGASGFLGALRGVLDGFAVAASTSRMDQRMAWVPPGGLIGPLVPQGAILERADLVVCSGTTSVVLGALEHGVPVVAIPAGSEQYDVAALVERACVGVAVPAHEATASRLGIAVADALRGDPAPRHALREAFARIDGPAVAADAIDRVLSATSGRRR